MVTATREITWLIPEPTSPIAARAAARTHGLNHPLVAQLLIRRGLIGDDLSLYLTPDLARLEDPASLRNIGAAVKVMDEAIRSGRKITIYGDYDVDGTTSTALLMAYLRSKGADPSFFIPQRNEGYGLTRPSLEKILAEHRPELIITVDCGTSSRAEIDYARSKGVEVIVTDHHLPTPGKQATGIVVNPHIAGDDSPNKGLAGVGVAYKLVAAHFGRQPQANLDLVSMGTVADVMPLIDVRDLATGEILTPAAENRVLVRAGLERLAHTKRVGLKALLSKAVKPSPCPHGATTCAVCPAGQDCIHRVPHCYAATSEDVGFQIGPRINAVSRMGLDPAIVVELLTTDDVARADEIAELLNETNKDRRELTNRLVDEAIAAVDPSEPVIVLQMDLFKGVAGLVAGRLANEFGRPAIVVDLDGSGSARSVVGVPLLDVLQTELSSLATAAGHQMAMGISNVRDVEALRDALNAHDWPDGLGSELRIDAVCTLSDLDRPLIEALRRLEPTGAGNPAPLFAVSAVKIIGKRLLGADKRHVRLTLQDSDGVTRQALYFSGAAKSPDEGTIIDVAGRPVINEFAGSVSVELHVNALRPTSERLAPTLAA